jgi:hypothetical protein
LPADVEVGLCGGPLELEGGQVVSFGGLLWCHEPSQVYLLAWALVGRPTPDVRLPSTPSVPQFSEHAFCNTVYPPISGLLIRGGSF